MMGGFGLGVEIFGLDVLFEEMLLYCIVFEEVGVVGYNVLWDFMLEYFLLIFFIEIIEGEDGNVIKLFIY